VSHPLISPLHKHTRVTPAHTSAEISLTRAVTQRVTTRRVQVQHVTATVRRTTGAGRVPPRSVAGEIRSTTPTGLQPRVPRVQHQRVTTLGVVTEPVAEGFSTGDGAKVGNLDACPVTHTRVVFRAGYVVVVDTRVEVTGIRVSDNVGHAILAAVHAYRTRPA
jgi:hypothetical protein